MRTVAVRVGWLAASAFVVLVVPAVPAAADECPPGEGTTVVVDFADLGGGVQVRCAPTASTGLEALTEAGFEVAAVQANPAFVCRIDDLPGTDTEDCVDTPPDSAFWSYWSADRGGEWRFQVSGASGSISGDLEGWAFSTASASPPGYSVPAPAATTTSTTTTTTATTTTAPTTTDTASTLATTAPTTTTTATSTTTTKPTTTTTEPTTTTASTTTSTTLAPTSTTDPAPSTTHPPTTPPPPEAAGAGTAEGGAGGFVVGLIGMAGIAVTSWVVARRRLGGP